MPNHEGFLVIWGLKVLQHSSFSKTWKNPLTWVKCVKIFSFIKWKFSWQSMIVFGQYSWSADLEYYNTSAILSVMKEAEYNALSPQVTSGVTINRILD